MNPRRIAIPLVFLAAFSLGSACPPSRDCPTGQVLCEGACTDSSIDVANCGACGHACAGGETCQAGVCGCTGGLASCAGVCSDLQSSAANCGGCGHACASTDACFGGQCGTSCPPDAGVINCSGSCVDTGSDPHNCGTCAHACQAKEVCLQGACDAPDLYAVCFSGSLIGYHSKTGVALPPFTVSVTLADGGAPIVPGGLGLLFTDAKTLWVLDTLNSLVDVLDVTNWPPTVLGSVSVGQSPNQLVLCDGMVLVVNSVDGTLQGIDPATRLTVNEVSLGAGTNPYLSACDGAHHAYVTDYASGDVKAVDLATWTVAATLAIPPQDFAPGAKPYPQGVAYVHPANWDAGAVFVALGNAAIDGGIFAPQGSALVLEFDAALQAVQAVIDPGSACTNGSYLTPSADGTQLYESCGGIYGAATTGFVSPIATATGTAGPLIQVPVANPSTSVALSGGLLAVDGSGNQVVVFNPYDAGVVQLLAPCPTLPDGGTVSPYDFVGGLARAAP